MNRPTRTRLPIAGMSALCLLLAACGGGGDEPGTTRERAQAIATPAQSTWSPLRTLPLVPVSMANLPDGKVLMWSAEEKFSFGATTGRTYSATYDPATGTVTERTVTETGHNMFCPGTTNLADGRLLVNGGISASRTSIFDPATNTWTTGAAMNIARGYQANTILKDGSVLTLGGSWSGGVGNKHGEVWTAAGGWRRLNGVPIDPFLSVDPSRNFGMDSHFMLLPAGNGKVFHAGPGINMHWIATEGNGRVADAGPRGDDEFSISGTTVMFEQGRILKTGGGPGYDSVNANSNSYVIDVHAGVAVRKTVPMAYRRAFHNSVVLPNGQVLIVGGQTYAVGFSDNNSVLAPELFDPVTETYTTLPPIGAPRNYHSIALLLPDARVVSAGGGLCGAGCAANHPDLQVWTPHYLLKPDGSPAVRPVITSAPASVRYGQTVTVGTDSTVASFAMVRVSSTTHTVNNDQRRLVLPFRAAGADTWSVDIPTNPGWALPGDWMLFALNADGTPSVAKIVRILLDGAPQFTAVDDQTGLVGTALQLQPAATAPQGSTLTFTATGLPPGLAIDPLTGRISGTPLLAGRFPVTLHAGTGTVTVSTEFVWQVDSPASLVPGLKGEYFATRNLTGAVARTVSEAVDYNWGSGSPGAGVPADNFSARWTGWLLPTVSGNHVLQTESDDGVRVWVDDVLVIDNWTDHAPALNNSAAIALTAGVRAAIRMEYYENGGGAVARLRWALPGSSTFAAVPLANLRSASLIPNGAPTLATPPSQSSVVGQSASLAMAASDPDGDALTFSAAGLPPGLAIAPATGVIGGAATTAGSYTVTVGVDDGRGGSTAVQFAWTVLDATPELLPVPAPAVGAGAAASYTADTTVLGSYSYRWDFGDGSAPTGWSASNTASHVFAVAGLYQVSVTARTSDGREATRSFWQSVQGAVGQGGVSSTPLLVEPRAGNPPRVWAVNPDNDSVSVFDTVSRTRVAEVGVGSAPRTLALAPDGRIWVVNKAAASISIVSPATLAVVQTVALPRASQPFGIVIGADGTAYVALEATGQVARVTSAGIVNATANVGAGVRHLALHAGGTRLLAARFVTPPLPGEGTASVQTSVDGAPRGGEVLVLDTSLALLRTIVLQHSERPDTTVSGRGVPNYLGAPAVAPDGGSAWVPSKQDNVKRGTLRDGLALDFQNTLRAISSRIDISAQAEDSAARIDHDNSGVASAAAFHPGGSYLFVALEASRHVAVVDAAGRRELFRVDAGRAPQGLAVSADGLTLYVQNFMDRTVGVYDLTRLVNYGETALPLVATMASVGTERLAAQVLRGKQFFYDARDPRLARDAYVSCAGCHNDGGHDGRTWDFTGFGEGLRNTIGLRGRAGAQGRLHWSANFDEVQDFEGQIRGFALGTGLMSDADFNAGTRSQPLGDAKAGLSADLDALAAYVASLDVADASPWRNTDGTLTAAAVAGRNVFAARCTTCHGGTDFTDSAGNVLHDIGTLKATSGRRLGTTLTGIDAPTLRDAWATAPYLHDGSAATIDAAIGAHGGIALTAGELADVAAFVRQIGPQEPAVAPPPPSGGPGLLGHYFANTTLAGAPVRTMSEAVNFVWSAGSGTASPGPGLPADGWSVRWSGFVKLPADGSYTFQVTSDDGIRAWIGGQLVADRWSNAGNTTFQSATVAGTANQLVAVLIEHYDGSGDSTVRLRWKTPSLPQYWVSVPIEQLVQTAGAPNAPPSVTVAAPAGGTVGLAIALNATATDSDGSITKVEFFDGGTPIGVASAAPYTVSWTPATAGVHSITARATDDAGAQTTSAAADVSVTAPVQGGGLLATYFANTTLAGSPVLTRIEAVDFTWTASNGTASPGAGVPADNWSARWSGSIELPAAGSYTFEFRADDGARIWLNGVQVADKWSGGGNATYLSATITATGATRIPVVFEHYDGTGDSSARIRWKTPSQSTYWIPVPAERLYTN